jgi:hypothetical protein
VVLDVPDDAPEQSRPGRRQRREVTDDSELAGTTETPN